MVKIGMVKIGRVKIGRVKIGRVKVGRVKIGRVKSWLPMVSVMSVPDSHMIGSDTKTLIVDTQCWNRFVQQDMYGSLVYHISCPSFLSPSLPLSLSPSSLYIRFFSSFSCEHQHCSH